MFDVVCISLLSPITLTVVSLCLYGATRYSPHRAEFVGLFVLGSLLLTLFIVWLVVSTRKESTNPSLSSLVTHLIIVFDWNQMIKINTMQGRSQPGNEVYAKYGKGS